MAMKLSAILNDSLHDSGAYASSYDGDRAVKRQKIIHNAVCASSDTNATTEHLAQFDPHNYSTEYEQLYTSDRYCSTSQYVDAEDKISQYVNSPLVASHVFPSSKRLSASLPALSTQAQTHATGAAGSTEHIAFHGKLENSHRFQTSYATRYECSVACEGILQDVKATTQDQQLLATSENSIDDDVCYGMICNIVVADCFAHENGRFKATWDGDQYLRAKDGSALAELHRRTTDMLTELSKKAGIHFQFWLYRGSEGLSFPIGVRTSTGLARTKSTVTISITMYGPNSVAEALGDWLQNIEMYLDEPEDCDYDVSYKNPHCLSYNSQSPIRTHGFSTSRASVVPLGKTGSAGDLAELYTDEIYEEAAQPLSILSPLHAHQKQALTFMLAREKGWCYSGPRHDVWRHHTDSFGRIRFKNMISDQIQRQSPKEFRGGLLADDMGLGKTCTMLSLIAASLGNLPEYETRSQVSSSCTGATLIVVPFSLLQVWEKQILHHFKSNTIHYLVYHNIPKDARADIDLSRYDIVVSTYNTVASERKHFKKGTHIRSVNLFSLHWHRLILDEAHVIRTWKTANARSVCELEADCRWAITGTPIQNRLSDIYSILKFLRVDPFENVKTFEDEILKPWKLNADQSALRKLQYLMKAIALRRPKAIVALPEIQNATLELELSVDERSVYDHARDYTIQSIDSAISRDKGGGNSFICAFQRLNDLRYICNHGRAPSKSQQIVPMPTPSTPSAQSFNDEELDILFGDSGIACVHCGVDIQDQQEEDRSFLHAPEHNATGSLQICKDCDTNQSWNSNSSPTPSTPLGSSGLATPTSPSPNVSIYSSKVRRLVAEIEALPGDDKCVVFSYWTSTLEVVGRALREAEITSCQFDGRLSRTRRDRVLYSFANDPSITALLVSITCGGAGLDLTAANHAFLLEPQWNPQLEEQAMARVHRLGQTKPVRLVRFIVKDTWEEKIRHLQERKRSLADLIVDRRSLQDGDDGRKQLYYLRELLS